jgi:hypothetical protein
MNGNAFLAYVEQILAPTLALGDMVVLDNLSAHKCAPPLGIGEMKERAVPIPGTWCFRHDSDLWRCSLSAAIKGIAHIQPRLI